MSKLDVSSDPLANLRDIHLPPSISWWPLAPGWYFLILMFALVIVCLAISTYRYILNQKPKRAALRLLQTYKENYEIEGQSHINAGKVSELLKRVALKYFPRKEVASLEGQAWIQFLNTTSKKLDFSKVKIQLLETPYQPAKNDDDLGELFNLAYRWIKQRRGRCLN